MLRFVHQFLKWLPPSAISAALAAAPIWQGAKDWIGSHATALWGAMSDPFVAAAVIGCILLYFFAMVYNGREGGPEARLSGEIELTVHGAPDIATQRVSIVLIMLIRNTGSFPSAIPVNSWRPYLKGKRYTVFPITVPSEGVRIHIGNNIKDFATGDHIAKLCTLPVQGGQIVHGYIVVELPSDSYALLMKRSPLIVEFGDVNGRKGKAQFKVKARTDRPHYIPFGSFSIG